MRSTKARKVPGVIDRLKQNDLLLHGAMVFVGLAVANVFNYLYYMLAGRVLGVEAYGELTSLTSALLTLAAPANVGQIIVARLAAGFQAAGSHAALRRLSQGTLRSTAAIALLTFLAAIIFRGALAGFFRSSPASVVATGAALAAYLVITVQRGVLQGSHRFGELSWSYVIEALVRVGTGIPLAVHYGALGALLGACAGAFVSLFYNIWKVRGATRGTGAALAFDLRRALRVASKIGVAQSTLTVLSFYDLIVVRHVFDARTAGLYAAAALAGRAMLGVLQFVPTIVMPKATARATSGTRPLRLLGAGLTLSGGLAAAGSIVAALAPAGVAAVFAGYAFRDAAPLVLPYMLAASALGIANVVQAYQIGLHRYSFVIPSAIVAIAEIALNSWWHPSPMSVVLVLLAGHALFLATAFIGTGRTMRAQ